MIKNYFVTAFRNLKNNFSHASLNVVGLSIGLACCLVVFTIINFEYSFDKWHKNKENVYRMTNIYYGDNRTYYNGIIPYPTGKVLKEEIPEIEKVVEFQGPDSGKLSYTLENGDVRIFRQNNILMTNEHFFDVLDFEIIKGNPIDLKEPFVIFLSETAAKKYFPDEDPMGKTLVYEGETSLEVKGIIKDAPNNTNLPFTCLISFETLRKNEPNIWKQWGMTWAHTIYVQVNPNTDIAKINVKIDETIDKARGEEEPEKTEVALQPLTEIHNDEKYGDGYNYVTPSLMIWAFIFLGGLILGTACLNFVNLNTAQAIKRSKEVGIRKTLGSSRKQLVGQFLMETLVIVFVSMLLALSMGQYLIQEFNKLITTIEYNLQYSSDIILFAFATVVVVTVLAGFYPSLILSGYRPVEALKNKINLQAGSGSFNLRRSLVVAQFVFTSVLLIGTLIIAAQVDFMKTKDLGFNPENVVRIFTPEESKIDPKTVLERYLTKNYVEDGTLSFTSPIDWNNWNTSYYFQGEEHQDGNNANMKFIDENYMDFYEIPLIAGQQIKEVTISDTTYNGIVTRMVLTSLGVNNPEEGLGRVINAGSERTKIKIIGVAEDFNVHSAHSQIRPAIFSYRPDMMNQIALHIKEENIKGNTSDIEATFREFYPDELFEFDILTHELAEQYMMEDLLHTVIQFVSFLAILLSVMGLYGLVSFMANRNAKVIGIRKVFGATTSNILFIFTKEYLKLMIIAFILAAPASYFLMNVWIEEFAFRIPITAKYFVAGFLISFVIALGTVGYRSFIAAKANPIKSLRYE